MRSIVRSRIVVTAEDTRPASVHVEDGRIVKVADYDDVPDGVFVESFGDAALLPGVVDSHVHINEPGRTEWEGFASATRAAAAGGVTTLVDMPLNSIPATTTLEGLHEKRAAAEGGIWVDVGFWGGVVPGNAKELAALWRAGVCGFKAFMSPSGVDEFENVSERDIRLALGALVPLGAPLLVHAESPAFLLPAPPSTSAERRQYATYLATRPPIAEQDAIALLTRLSSEYGAHIHVVHLATAEAVPALARARAEGVRLTVETCPHYLHFASDDVPDGRTEYKCAPPIRDTANRAGLWAALKQGTVDLIATDHSPCPPALKHPDTGDFIDAWGGIASLQLGLSIVWTGASARGFALDDVARWMCQAPATLAGLGSKGKIAVGHDADFVAFDPSAVRTVDGTQLAHRHKVTPYDGATLKGMVRATFVRGRCVFRDGELIGAPEGRLLRGRGTEDYD